MKSTAAQAQRTPSLDRSQAQTTFDGVLDEEAGSFLCDLFQGKPVDHHVYLFLLPSRRTEWFRNVEEIGPWLADNKARLNGQNIYFGLSTTRQRVPGRRANAQEAAGIGCFWADIDCGDSHKEKNLPPDCEAAVSLAREMPLSPTRIVLSGHGLHCYWQFDDFWEFKDENDRLKAAAMSAAWKDQLRERAEAHGWKVDSVFDLARILRVPGTLNHKDAPPVRVHILEDHSGPRVTREMIFEHCDAAPPSIAVASPTENAAGGAPPAAPTTPSSERSPGLPEGWIPDFSVTVSQDVIDMLCETDPEFACVWRRERSDFPSTSEYEQAIASRLAPSGIAPDLIVAICRKWRQHHGEGEKGGGERPRADYYRLTLHKALTRSRTSALTEPLKRSLPEFNIEATVIDARQQRGRASITLDVKVKEETVEEAFTFWNSAHGLEEASKDIAAHLPKCTPKGRRLIKAFLRKLSCAATDKIGRLPTMRDVLAIEATKRFRFSCRNERGWLWSERQSEWVTHNQFVKWAEPIDKLRATRDYTGESDDKLVAIAQKLLHIIWSQAKGELPLVDDAELGADSTLGSDFRAEIIRVFTTPITGDRIGDRNDVIARSLATKEHLDGDEGKLGTGKWTRIHPAYDAWRRVHEGRDEFAMRSSLFHQVLRQRIAGIRSETGFSRLMKSLKLGEAARVCDTRAVVLAPEVTDEILGRDTEKRQ